MTFSSTVMELKLRTTWKVRAMPSSEHCSGDRPEIRRPFRRTSPESGVTSPEIALNSERLACAVRADQPQDLALAHVETDIDIGRDAAEGLADRAT